MKGTHIAYKKNMCFSEQFLIMIYWNSTTIGYDIFLGARTYLVSLSLDFVKLEP